jgi:hypothetical protein
MNGMPQSAQEYGYRCRQCGTGTAYGALVSEGGQVKLWCFSCLRDALNQAPQDLPSAESREPRAESATKEPTHAP